MRFYGLHWIYNFLDSFFIQEDNSQEKIEKTELNEFKVDNPKLISQNGNFEMTCVFFVCNYLSHFSFKFRDTWASCIYK